MREMNRRYAPGLAVLGLHTPEFPSRLSGTTSSVPCASTGSSSRSGRTTDQPSPASAMQCGSVRGERDVLLLSIEG